MRDGLLPWGAMMRAALSAGIGPEAFWRLSLKEWRWLARGGDAMGRGRMVDLMGAFPDGVGRATPAASSFGFAQDESGREEG